MSDPSRLHEDAGADGFERALLQAGRHDREPSDGAERALAALGLASSASALAASTAARTAATGSTSTGSAAVGLSVKLVGAALLTTGLVVAGLLALGGPSASSGVPAVVSASPQPNAPGMTHSGTSEPSQAERAAGDTVASDAVSVDDLPSAPAPARSPVLVAARRATSPPVQTAPPPAPSLAEELALVDEARAAIARGDSATAEIMLDAYDARFANGRLALEAKLARIEMLLARGDSAQARSLCEAFLRENPRTAYERRARALLRRADSSISQ
jgi:hypothetical protein